MVIMKIYGLCFELFVRLISECEDSIHKEEDTVYNSQTAFRQSQLTCIIFNKRVIPLLDNENSGCYKQSTSHQAV